MYNVRHMKQHRTMEEADEVKVHHGTSQDFEKEFQRKSRKCFLPFFTVEPVFFLMYFASSFTDSVVTNVIESRVCTVNLKYPSANCTEPLSPDISGSVQQDTAHFITAKTIIEASFPALLSFFIGPWTDINGRKPFLLAAIGGYFLFYVLWGCLTYFGNVPPMYFLFASVPLSISGGIVSIFVCCYCYIGDVTLERNRGVRMACVQLSLMVGILAGSLLIPKVLKAVGRFGSETAFATSSIICLLTLLYVAFCLPETVTSIQGHQNRSLFDLFHAKEMFKAILEKRLHHGRTIILFLIAVCTISVSIMRGETIIKYMTVQQRFKWTLENYSEFSALASLITVVVALSGIWIFSRFLKMSDMVIALVVIFLSLLSQLAVALSTTSVWFIIAVNVGCLEVLIVPLTRSQISKIVPKTDLGKAFAFISAMEAVIPLLIAPIYSVVYATVVKTMPMAVYFLSVGFSAFNVILLLSIVILNHVVNTRVYMDARNI